MFLKYFYRSILALAMLLIIAFGAGYAFLFSRSDELLEPYLAELNRKTGLIAKYSSIDANLLPIPALSASGVRITGPDAEIRCSWIAIRPNFLKLLTGKFEPGTIVLLKPEAEIRIDLSLADPSSLYEKLKTMTNGKQERKGFDGINTSLEIQQGKIDLFGLDETALTLASFNCQLLLAEEMLEGNLRFAALRGYDHKTPAFSIEKFSWNGKVSLSAPFSGKNNYNLSGVFTWPGRIYSLTASANFGGSGDAWILGYTLAGELDFETMPTPFSLAGEVNHLDSTDSYILRNQKWSLGADSGFLEAELELPENPADFILDGTFMAKRLSLTQWLGFARNLCPGLQLSLDNVMNSHLKFRLTGKSLEVPFIKATCVGATFTGSGGVPDFAAPVVVLDLESEKANLGLALGESLVKSPQAPWYGHGTLTPMPGEPLKPGETGIGYDVRLAAKKLIYGTLLIDNASLRIRPGKIDEDGLEEVILDADADFYGGKFTGKCVLGAPADLPLTITAHAEKVSAQKVYRDLKTLPMNRGIFQADANVESRGKLLAQFLANLRGNITIQGSDAGLEAVKDEIFTKLELGANLKGASSTEDSAVFNAKWNLALDNKKFLGKATLDGSVTFSEKGAAFAGLPFNASLTTLDNSLPLPAKTELKIKGIAGGQTAAEKFTFKNCSGSVLGLAFSGSANVDSRKSAVDGRVKLDPFKISALLKKFGVQTAVLPSALDTCTFDSAYSFKNNAISFSGLKAKLGTTAIAGSASWQTSHAKLQFELEGDKLDLESLTAQNSTKRKNSSWDYPFMRLFNASGELKIRNLYGWKMAVKNAELPVRLEKGKLSFGPGRGEIYGGTVNLSGTAEFGSALLFSATGSLKNISLEQAVKNRKLNGVLLGRGNLDCHFNAVLTGQKKLVPALNGTWSILLTGCSWDGLNKNGKPKGKPTVINRADAKGEISGGVIKSSAINIQGTDLKAAGQKCTVNLESKKLDCKLDVDMKGVPDFPLTFSGSYDNPKTSIGAGKMVLNALGGIVSGIGNAIGGMAKGVASIFR